MAKMRWTEARADYDRIFDQTESTYGAKRDKNRDGSFGKRIWDEYWAPAIREDQPKHWPYDPNPYPHYDGTPLQEQVEQVEDALSKALDVIEAMVAQEKELRNDVYQAQVDAQDWQNKYNALDSESKDYIADREGLIDNCRDLYREECIKSDRLQERIELLTQQNTALKVRNEVQAKRLLRIQSAVGGVWDGKMLFVRQT